MKNKKIWLVLLVLPLLVANYVWAQGIPSGKLSGKVGDEGGAGLPGVAVTVTSPALQGSRTTVTNVNGDYIFPNVPPGEYTVTAALSGFHTETRTTKVSSGQEVLVNVKLVMAGVETKVTVAAQSETISQTAQATTTVSYDTMNKLPVARTLLSAVLLTPGMNQNGPNGSVTINGSASYDSIFTVNGVNVQDNIRGTPGNLFIEDAIQETSSITSAVSAEYGRFTGGIVNAVTKRGGNTFSGSFRMTETNDNNKALTPIPTTYIDKWVPVYEGTLGGPIWKDTIWFFGAGRYNKLETSASTVAITPGAPTTSIPRTDQNDRWEGKLTISPFPSHTLTGSYLWTTTHTTNYAYPFPILDATKDGLGGFLYNRQTPSDLLAFNYNGVVSSDFFLEGTYSKKTFTFINSGGNDLSLVGGTAFLVQEQGNGQMWAPLFCGSCDPEHRDNENISGKGTYFLSSQSLGTHNVSFGYQYFATFRKANNYQSGSNWIAYPTSVVENNGRVYPIIDGNSYLNYAPIPLLSQGSKLLTQSAFVNDDWKLGSHVTFNLGVRYDKNDATDSSGHTTADDSQWSPRLSASYDIGGDGKFRVTGSYARYVGQLQETLAGSGASGAGNPAYYYYFWGGADINTHCPPACTPTAAAMTQWFLGEGVTAKNMFPNREPDSTNIPGVSNKIVSPLKSPNANEYSIGVGGAVGSNFVYRVDAIRREFNDFYALSRNLDTGFINDVVGNQYNLGFFVNSNVPKKNYTSLNTALSYRAGPLTVGANWTWSHTITNFIAETTGNGPINATMLNYPEYVQQSWNYPNGDAAQDQRHRVRLYGAYDVRLGPVSITPGLIQFIDTGTPYGAATTTLETRPYVPLSCSTPGIDQSHCYVTPPSSETYYFTSRSAYRTPTVLRTDFSLNIAGRIGPVEIFVMPQVLNIFNGQTATFANNPNAINTSVFNGRGATPDSRGLVRFNPFTTAPIECPQADTAAQCAAMGANWKKGPSFGQPVSGSSTQPSFQIPRQWLVSFGARF